MRLAAWVGGDEGKALAASGDEWIAREGVRNGDRMLAMIAPTPP
jgi:hypothetical protein